MIHEGGRAQAELSYLVSAAVAGAVGSWVFWGPQGSKYSRRRGTQLSSGGWVKNAHAFSLCLGGTFNFILLLNLIRKENKKL